MPLRNEPFITYKTGLKIRKIPIACKDLQDPCCEICWTPHSKERSNGWSRIQPRASCFNVAHAFAPTIGITLCNLVVITTMMPAQVQTNQRNGTVQPARTSLRSNGKLGPDLTDRGSTLFTVHKSDRGSTN